jgi:hypothetical protein
VKPYIFHILVNAGSIQEDNRILQPYLDEWSREHEKILQACRFAHGNDPKFDFPPLAPTISPAPILPSPACTSTKQLDTINDASFQSGGESTAQEGIMFDVVSNREDGSRLLIEAFDVNTEYYYDERFQVYAKIGSWRGSQRDEEEWTDLGQYSVEGQRQDNPTRITLDESVVMEAGETRAFYIVQLTDDNVMNIIDAGSVGDVLKQDDNLSILVGLAISGRPFRGMKNKEYDRRLGFSGIIHYTVCKSDVSPARALDRQPIGVRLLDHQYIGHWNDGPPRNKTEFSSKKDWFDPFRLWPSPVSTAQL